MTTVDLRQLAVDRSGSAHRPRRRRHLLTRYILPAALFIGFAALAAWAAKDFLLPPHRVQVVSVIVAQAEFQQEGTPLFKAAGWVEPRPTAVRVAALSAGTVERLLVVEDQAVKAGDPIAELIKDDARLNLARSEAELQLRKAELAEAVANLEAATTRFEKPVHLDAILDESEISLARIQTQLKNLTYETKRAEVSLQLAKQEVEAKSASAGAVSGLAVARANSESQQAEALLAELKERRGSLEKELGATMARHNALRTQRILLTDETRARDEAHAKVDAARSRLESGKIAITEAKLRLDRMTVKAPIDGRIYRLIGSPGTTLTGGTGTSDQFDGSTVVTMYRPESLQTRVDVRFEDIPKVNLGQPVQVENPALKDPLIGKVLFVSSLANIQKNTLEVKVAIESAPAVLKPEMLVNVTFLAPATDHESTVPTEELRLFLPKELVHRAETGAFVWLADQSSGIAKRTVIEVGATTGNGLVEIRSGLTVSSRVIATGIENLEDGDRIAIVESSEGAVTGGNSPPASDALERLPKGGVH